MVWICRKDVLRFARRNPENMFFNEDDCHPSLTLHSFTNNGWSRRGWQRGLEPSLHDRPSWEIWPRETEYQFSFKTSMAENADMDGQLVFCSVLRGLWQASAHVRQLDFSPGDSLSRLAFGEEIFFHRPWDARESHNISIQELFGPFGKF